MEQDNNKELELQKLREEALAHFIEINDHLTKEEATQLFENIEKKFREINEGMERHVMVITKKLKVLSVARHIFIISLILSAAGFILPRNSINIWYQPIGLVLSLTTVIFTHLFIRFYGRRKKRENGQDSI